MSKNNKKSDTSPRVHQNTKIRDDVKIDQRELTPKQIELLELLKNKKYQFCTGYVNYGR